MKQLVYIVTFFLALVFSASAESKPVTALHYSKDHSLHKELSVSQNDISIVFVDLNDDFCPEDKDEIDLGDHSFDHFAFLDFGETISFVPNLPSYKLSAYANGTHQIVHADNVPLYILFHSMMIPSAN